MVEPTCRIFVPRIALVNDSVMQVSAKEEWTIDPISWFIMVNNSNCNYERSDVHVGNL